MNRLGAVGPLGHERKRKNGRQIWKEGFGSSICHLLSPTLGMTKRNLNTPGATAMLCPGYAVHDSLWDLLLLKPGLGIFRVQGPWG